MGKYEVTKSIDVRGEVCPVPDVEAKRAVKKMKPGEILEVWIDYPMSKERIPEGMKKMGHEVLEIEEVGNSEWKIYIKVK
ncbi:sulfurtransferase TusA family protein [Marinitoga lauensis]|jgi:tRNA 2-thiouridine synthesizing protein A|uniref:sulfurtransferase TusA family protein n=1 Tax=Marinitoga lauensis TaxID=2201189 RepID=UPI00101235E3|nr:sulfurtransferase TusA family protein [Marinitoga lauensis]